MVKKMLVLLGLVSSHEAMGYTWTVETIDHTTSEKRVFLPPKDKDWDLPKDAFKEGSELFCYLSKEKRFENSDLYNRNLNCTNNVKGSLRMGISIYCYDNKDLDEFNKNERRITYLFTSKGEHYGTIILKCTDK
jgi:hypothetical protein